MSSVKWIKICTDIFDDEKILLVESLPEADSVLVIWFKLLCLSGRQNNSGVIMLNDKIAYTDEMLAAVFRRPLNTVKFALNIFEQYGMIEIIDGTITIPNWEKHQSLEKLEKSKELARERKLKYREKQQQLSEKSERNADGTQTERVPNENGTLMSRTQNKNKNKNKNIEREIYKEKEKKAVDETAVSPPPKYGEYENVILSTSDIEKLKSEFPDWEQRIERLSEYVASTGKKYKSHLATIRSWARKDKEQKPKLQKATINASESERLSAEIIENELKG